MKLISLMQKIILVTGCLLLIGCSNDFEIVDISLATWKGDKKAAFSITSADGLIRSIKSQWTPENPDVPYDGYYKLGKEHDIPITFFIIPRLQDDVALNDFSHKYFSSRTPPALEPGFGGTWEDWRFMHQQGHEIASHTYSHDDFREGEDGKPVTSVDPHWDMAKSIESIEKNIGVKPILVNFGLGHPSDGVLAITRQYFPIHAGDVFRSEQVVNIVFKKITTFEKLNSTYQTAYNAGKWFLIRAHGLRSELGRKEEAAPDFTESGKRYDGFSPGDYNVLDSLFQTINLHRDSIYIDVFSNVYRYLIERDESVIEVNNEDPSRKIITINNELNNEVYNIPLTVKMTLSRDKKVPEIIQNGEKIPVTRKGQEFIFEVIPGSGEIYISL